MLNCAVQPLVHMTESKTDLLSSVYILRQICNGSGKPLGLAQLANVFQLCLLSYGLDLSWLQGRLVLAQHNDCVPGLVQHFRNIPSEWTLPWSSLQALSHLPANGEVKSGTEGIQLVRRRIRDMRNRIYAQLKKHQNAKFLGKHSCVIVAGVLVRPTVLLGGLLHLSLGRNEFNSVLCYLNGASPVKW